MGIEKVQAKNTERRFNSDLGLAWAFEASKFAPSDMPPPTSVVGRIRRAASRRLASLAPEITTWKLY